MEVVVFSHSSIQSQTEALQYHPKSQTWEKIALSVFKEIFCMSKGNVVVWPQPAAKDHVVAL